jgi:hypothetical protein
MTAVEVALENHLNKIENDGIFRKNYIDTAMNCGLFDDPQALKFFSMMIENDKLEQIFVNAIRKKNVAILDLLIDKMNGIMSDMMEMCNDWVNEEGSYVNEQSYLLVCQCCKMMNTKMNNLRKYAKQSF